MASYPTTVKTFTAKVNGPGNPIQAEHVNSLQDEVTAIEQALLSTGFLHATGVNIAPQSDVQLSVARAAGTTGHKTFQADMNVEAGTGGSHIGAQINCRTSALSAWDGTGGFLYGLGIEAGTRRAGSATVMGLNVQGKIWNGGSGNSLNVVEINACSEDAPTSRSLLTLSPVPSTELPTTENDPASGDIDTALLVAAKRYGAKLKYGLLFYQPAGAEAVTGFRWPIQTGGSFITAIPGEAVTVADGVNIFHANLTISGYAFKSPKFRVTGAGTAIVGSNADPIGTFDVAAASGDTDLLWYRSSGELGRLRALSGSVDLGSYSNHPVRLFVNSVEIVRVLAEGSVQIGGTAARSGTAGTKRLDIFDGTAPTGTLAAGCSLYSTSGELRVMDAAGNATLLSPHDQETNEWIYHSKHTPSGRVLRIDVERLLRALDAQLGGGFVTELHEEAA